MPKKRAPLSKDVQACLNALEKPKLEQHHVRQQKGLTSQEQRMMRTGKSAVAAVLSVTAICAAVLAYGLLICWRRGYQVVPALLAVYAMAEALFSVAWRQKYKRLNNAPHPHAPGHPSFDPRDAFDRFKNRMSSYVCVRVFLQTWFWKVPFEQITRGNVADLMTYGFWYKTREQLEAEGQGHLPDQLVSELEDAWGIKFTEGHNKELDWMAHIWQPLRCAYRPLILYLLIEYVYLVKHVVLCSFGFRSFRHAGFDYYTHGELPLSKPGDKNERQAGGVPSTLAEVTDDSTKVPILFLHGTGVGMLPYKDFIARLACTGHPVLAFQCNHLGMRWVSYLPEVDEVVEGIQAVLARHGVKRVCLVGHSYGTLIASRYLQLHPDFVQSIVLIDPVTFAMFTGNLIHNFLYDPETTTDPITTFVARDIHHAATVQRRFYWSILNLWPHQLPSKALVVLSGQDDLVAVPETIAMLHREAPHAVLLYRHDHEHAGFMKDPELQTQILEEMLRMLRCSSCARMQQDFPYKEECTQQVKLE